MLLRALIFLRNRPRGREKEKERKKTGDPREKNLRHSGPSGASLFTRVRNTHGRKMVSSFRALSFASRVLGGKNENEREKGQEREMGEKRCLSLYRNGGSYEKFKPEGRIFSI